MQWIEAVKQLSSSLDEPFELEFVWRNLHELSKLAWLNRMRENISEKDFAHLAEITERLNRHEPPQYIVGWAEFCGLRFTVNPQVLIPRPETEELVLKIAKENIAGSMRVLDMGTGSGAIAVSLAKLHPDWKITASDISDAALEVAKSNAQKNDVTVQFVHSDVMSNITGQFDLIVSNPPYISFADKAEVDLSVLQNEPENALFAEKDGLAVYEQIAQQAAYFLTKNGKMYFEIGYKQGEVVKTLFETAFPQKKVTVLQDFSGKDRIVRVE
ncbi:MAG: peptide chain release factor N(5)-glutamine methyltransferase [Streptococcaceae bacterium]|jgi:release factor glutamine methyltransferase|nr:peptide chain release factor N(5)-glutamine methyltransferase [Streptococcaceae bacterium]